MARKSAENLAEQWSYDRIDKALQHLLDQPKRQSAAYKDVHSMWAPVRRFYLKDFELKILLER